MFFWGKVLWQNEHSYALSSVAGAGAGGEDDSTTAAAAASSNAWVSENTGKSGLHTSRFTGASCSSGRCSGNMGPAHSAPP